MNKDNIRLEMRTTLGRELKKDGEYLFDFLFRNLDCTEKDIMQFVDNDLMDDGKYQSLERFYILHIRGVCTLRNLEPKGEASA